MRNSLKPASAPPPILSKAAMPALWASLLRSLRLRSCSQMIRGGARAIDAGGHQQQRVGADVAHQQRGQRRADNGAGAGAGADKAEQSSGLGPGEGVGHEAPEHRDMEQAEQADPDVEGLVQQHPVLQCLGADVEQAKAGGEQAVYRGHQAANADAGDRCAVEPDREGAADKGERPQPADLGIAPVAGHGVPHRPQDVVGAHEDQHQAEGRQGRAHLVRFDLAGPREQALQGDASSARYRFSNMCSISARCCSLGTRPKLARILSSMWCTLAVAGMMQVTAG